MAVLRSAAGLLATVCLLLGLVGIVAGDDLNQALIDTFKARALARHYFRQQKVSNTHGPYKRRTRRSQIRLNVPDEGSGESADAIVPYLIHPSRYEDERAASQSVNDTSDDSTSTFNGNDTRADTVRYGRTSSMSERNRPINSLIYSEMQSGKGDSNAREYTLLYASLDPFATLPATASNSSASSDAMLDEQSSRNDSKSLWRLEKQGSSSTTAVPTWQGQPSDFKPKVPYEPSAHKADDYGDILSKSLWFYQVQRSGLLAKTPRPVPWRNDSALQDGFDNKIDLTGGYYDAGDYLKFTLPLSAALTTLAWSGVEHWQGVLHSDNIGYWDETLRWGLDWLIKAHPTSERLYAQVGNGDIDNNYWGGDRTIPGPRPSFYVDRSKPGTDVMAGTAAAFAAGAIFYSSIIGDDKYARTLLKHALSLYYVAESAPKLLYQKSVPAVKDWYSSSDYSDELVLAGLLLYRATKNEYFLERAELYFDKYKVADNRDPVDWDSKHGSCLLLGAQLVEQNGVKSKVDWRSNLVTYLKEAALKQGKTPGGLLYYTGSSEENSLPTAMGITYLMTEFARIFPDDDAAIKIRQLADSQIDYVFGKNPRHMSYVVGVSPKSPKNPQSAMASGGNDIGNVDHSPEQMAHVLYGGLVGGPAKDDSFQDKRSNYKQSECALDYNAPLTAILASEYELQKLPYFARK